LASGAGHAPIGAMAVVRAAGGVLWRRDAGRPRIALVHRPRHGDWSLPKGKLRNDEGWEEAALREVEEETGCQGRISGFAGATCYVPRRAPKVVLYWHMTLEREGPLEAGDEIDEVVWLEPEEALARLDYEPEKRLVERAPERGGAGAPPPRGPLAAEIATVRAELVRGILALGSDGDASGVGPALDLLDQAGDAAGRGDPETGRRLAAAARRMALLGLRGAGLLAAAQALREEARALPPARRRAVRRLLPNGERPTPEALYLAATIRDQRIESASASRALTWAILGVAGVALALVIYGARPLGGWPVLASAVAAGLVGGAAASATLACRRR